jgi:AraC-like DNA-binding protein
MSPRYWPVFGQRPRRLRLSRLARQTVNAWFADFQVQAPYLAPQSEAVLTLCLVEMIRTSRRLPEGFDGLDPFRQKLWPVLEQIATDPYASWSLTRMAGMTNLSPRHFSRCFHDVLDQSPKHYLFQARMRAVAAEITADPTPALKDISARAGYASVHVFARAFRNFYGVSPGAYRQRTLKP